MIYSTQYIADQCKSEADALIWPFDRNKNQGNPAKIELHLGEKCYCSNAPDKIIDLESGSSTIVAPNSIFLFQTLEKVQLPKNISGRMSLKMGLVSKGLLMPNQTQVDPGYRNHLFGMIYNLSDQNIELKHGQSITTLELFETQRSSDTFYEYKGSMQNCTFDSFVRTRIRSSLGSLAANIQETHNQVENSQAKYDKYVTFLSILLAVIAIANPIAGYHAAFKDDAAVARLEEKVTYLETEIESYERTLDSQAEQLTRYEEIIKELEERIDIAANDTSTIPEP